MCDGCLCVSYSLVSVICVYPGLWGERRMDWVAVEVWQVMFGVLVLWWICVMCLVSWDFPSS